MAHYTLEDVTGGKPLTTAAPAGPPRVGTTDMDWDKYLREAAAFDYQRRAIEQGRVLGPMLNTGAQAVGNALTDENMQLKTEVLRRLLGL